ncbi:MAG: hypothetical protein CM15mP19_12130 [Gammaproteobacteria bacterium]|nr:MAG: hypothetical protein CM15mP19_12130 [Gammaproteobacteria bacterium]
MFRKIFPKIKSQFHLRAKEMVMSQCAMLTHLNLKKVLKNGMLRNHLEKCFADSLENCNYGFWEYDPNLAIEAEKGCWNFLLEQKNKKIYF